MNNQTAVEWLIEQIKNDQFKKVKTLSEWSEIFEQAKELEKQQIINAWIDAEGYNDVEATKHAEEYYNKTYKSKL